MLPIVFLSLTTVMLLMALFAMWQSFRAVSGALKAGTVLVGTGSVERQALENEKAALLESLRDLKFEWQVGKLSDAHYREQEQLLRQRTREVMRNMDMAVEPFRQRAAELIAAEVGAHDTRAEVPAVSQSVAGESNARTADSVAEAVRVCGACYAQNDGDADFCKKCGTPLEVR